MEQNGERASGRDTEEVPEMGVNGPETVFKVYDVMCTVFTG